MKCTKCGSNLIDGTNFCMGCGTPVVQTPESVSTNPEKPAVPQDNTPQEKTVAPKKHGKAATTIAFVTASAIILSGTAGYIAVKNDFLSIASSAEKEAASAAKELFDNGDYADAAEQYCAAISESAKKVEYYQGAAEAYLAMGDNEKAEDVLCSGVMNTGSVELEKMLKNIRKDKPAAGEQAVTSEEKSEQTPEQGVSSEEKTEHQPDQTEAIKYLPVSFTYKGERFFCENGEIFMNESGNGYSASVENFVLRSDGTFSREVGTEYYIEHDGEFDSLGAVMSSATFTPLDDQLGEYYCSLSSGYSDIYGIGGSTRYILNSHGYVSECINGGEGGGSSEKYYYEYNEDGTPSRIHSIHDYYMDWQYSDVMNNSSQYDLWATRNKHYLRDEIPEFCSESKYYSTESFVSWCPKIHYVENQYCFELKHYTSSVVNDDVFSSLCSVLNTDRKNMTTDDKGFISSVTVTDKSGVSKKFTFDYSFDSDGMPIKAAVSDGTNSYELKYEVTKTTCKCEYDDDGKPVKGTYFNENGELIATAQADYVVFDDDVLESIEKYEAQNGVNLED